MGAIHRAAGPDLLHECRLLGGCKTGEAKATKGYNLPAKLIFHTVGPKWRGGIHGEPELLASCYRKCIELAAIKSVRTLAFPSISTGIYGYPIEFAAQIAVRTAQEASLFAPKLERVIFCCFSESDFLHYEQALGSSVA